LWFFIYNIKLQNQTTDTSKYPKPDKMPSQAVLKVVLEDVELLVAHANTDGGPHLSYYFFLLSLPSFSPPSGENHPQNRSQNANIWDPQRHISVDMWDPSRHGCLHI